MKKIQQINKTKRGEVAFHGRGFRKMAEKTQVGELPQRDYIINVQNIWGFSLIQK